MSLSAGLINLWSSARTTRTTPRASGSRRQRPASSHPRCARRYLRQWRSCRGPVRHRRQQRVLSRVPGRRRAADAVRANPARSYGAGWACSCSNSERHNANSRQWQGSPAERHHRWPPSPDARWRSAGGHRVQSDHPQSAPRAEPKGECYCATGGLTVGELVSDRAVVVGVGPLVKLAAVETNSVET